ncbi:hypothetical protein [Ruegeria sp. R14_0]|uniref:hypothetical protein n=1 Tax=Ruegeria sp. R14_0 TaxID=2821100 RepID=UPI001ADB0666|nr:hypothetical protein [Ruegeria sp. R14_0]MBO9446899.1 hypothetical protein [Ruegeria sp. R14_0]
MKIIATLALGAGLISSPVFAGGIEGFPSETRFLFEQGRYVEITGGWADGKTEGTEFGQPTGDVTPSISGLSLAYKQDLGEKWVFAIRGFNSINYKLQYPTGTGAPSAGTNVRYRGTEVAVMARYKFNENISAYAGIRFEKLNDFSGALINPSLSYSLDSEGDYNPGFLVGAAYEIPSLAFRADLTYFSKIDHDLDGVEQLQPLPPSDVTTQLTTPQTVALNVQSSISGPWGAFGSIRWRNWDDTAVQSPALGGPLAEFAENSVDYQLGVGYLLNPKWYFYGILSRSQPEGGFVGFDYQGGGKGITLGAVHSIGQTRILVDVTYGTLGDVNEPDAGLQIRNVSGTAVRVSVSHNF